MHKIALVGKDGRFAGGNYARPGKTLADEGHNPDDLKEVAVHHWPDHWQRYHHGRWVDDPAARAAAIDAAHAADHGSHAIPLAHMRKAIEARIMLAGLPIDGLVAQEAKALGRDPVDLAHEIAAKDSREIAVEIGRRKAKTLAIGKTGAAQ